MPGPLGTIHRGNGTVQVTINGYPIYYYVGDKAPGQIAGDGVEGSWHIIKIKTATNTGGGGGYGY